MISQNHGYNDLNSEDTPVAIGKHNVPMEDRFLGHLSVPQSQSNHRCPVCGEVAECLTDDKFHNCNLCGSTWKSLNAL